MNGKSFLQCVLLVAIVIFLQGCLSGRDVASVGSDGWVVDSQESWTGAKDSAVNIEIKDGLAMPTENGSRFSSIVKQYKQKRKARLITFKQSDIWDNWKEVDNVGPAEMRDAVVFVPVKDGDYWLLARHSDYGSKGLYKAKESAGYHAWHSTDMKKWEHKGPVSDYQSRWVTTAEVVDGTFYIYYDHPNDEDPHLIIDKDMNDGKMGEDMGMAFTDPTHGSDSAIFRDEDGSFHLIYENWSYMDARKHSWDGPVAGHAVSADGISDFKILAPAVDDRTTPTGRFAIFKHPQNPVIRYEIHEPEQNAYGDWTAIKVGGQYYLFCDFHPAGKKIRIGRWTSDSLSKQFTWCGELGMGHPDPTVGFAEGQFYLIQQRGNIDFVSPGPWVGGVEARVGVDTNGNGTIDHWTDWQKIEESYSQKPGFVRIVETGPASIDLKGLAAGYGFKFEYKTTKIANQKAKPIMDHVSLSFR